MVMWGIGGALGCLYGVSSVAPLGVLRLPCMPRSHVPVSRTYIPFATGPMGAQGSVV